MIRCNPSWHRSRLSVELCGLWDWKSPDGKPKDISCRDMLRDLEKAGRIILPPALRITRVAGGGSEKVERISHCTKPVESELHKLKPLTIKIAQSKQDIAIFKSYIAQFHYLGFDRTVGENIKYIVMSKDGVPLACMMFGSAAWKCRPRDEYIGWDDGQRRAGLQLITNNVRNLVFPWIRVPHLASHALAAVTRRISSDWQAKYGHPVFLLETFVERDRFRGIMYKAANWINVGITTGRGRNSETMQPTLPVKDVWIYPLRADFRDKMN